MVYRADDPARFRVVVLSPEELAAEVAVVNAQRSARRASLVLAAAPGSVDWQVREWAWARLASRRADSVFGGRAGLEAAAREMDDWSKANPGWEKRLMGRERQAWKPRVAGKRKPVAA